MVRSVHLLGLVAEATGLVWAGRLGGPVDGRHLPELPSANALGEAQHIGLLAVPKLAKVLVGSHFLQRTERDMMSAIKSWVSMNTMVNSVYDWLCVVWRSCLHGNLRRYLVVLQTIGEKGV